MGEAALPVALDYDESLRRDSAYRMKSMCRFFMGDDLVHQTLGRITRRLQELGIPYAVAGGMALNAHGFVRATTDVDILVNPEGLMAIHRELEGLGYVPPFAGSKNLKDTATGVRVEFLVSGQFPGDGKPKPVAFPEPSIAFTVIDGVQYLALSTLVEMKLASGMTNAGRLKDLGDVQELIRILGLGRDYSGQLNPYVRAKFEELWEGVHSNPSEAG